MATDTSALTSSAPPTVAEPSGPARATVSGVTRSFSIVPLLTRLHFYGGILVAPLLVVAAVTGLLFVFAPQLDGFVYDRELHVAQVGLGLPKPMSEQVAAAMAAHPEGILATVIPASAPDATTRVVFTMPELGEKQDTVYIDPYSGEVRGQLVTWFGETPLMTWLDDLHRNLLLDDLGRPYSEAAASWLWVLALGGLVLWCNRQWRRRGNARRDRLAATIVPELSAAKGVRRTRSFHAVLGVWLTVGLLFLSVTGLTWSRWAGENFTRALDELRAHSPELNTSLTGAATTGGGAHHSEAGAATAVGDPAQIDTVLHVARGAGITGPIEVSPPAEEGMAWTVAQNDVAWPVRMDRIAVDPTTSTVTARSNFADWPLLARLSKLGVQAHMGYLFGFVNQLLLAALSIGLLCVIVWGYRMWWQRRPTRAGRRAPVGAPPARGAWRSLRIPLLVLGIALTAAVGWALPAFGVTLLAFLVLDGSIGLVKLLIRRSSPAAV